MKRTRVRSYCRSSIRGRHPHNGYNFCTNTQGTRYLGDRRLRLKPAYGKPDFNLAQYHAEGRQLTSKVVNWKCAQARDTMFRRLPLLQTIRTLEYSSKCQPYLLENFDKITPGRSLAIDFYRVHTSAAVARAKAKTECTRTVVAQLLLHR